MNETTQHLLIKNLGAEKIVAQLQPFVSPRRQQRIEQVLNNRLQSIQIALEMPTDLHNAFAVIRSCEIFGILKIHIIAPDKLLSGIRPISKGAMDWVDIAFYPNIQDFLQEMQHQNYRLAGAIPRIAHHVDTVPIEEPVCLLLGNEHNGLSAIAQQACDWHYQIPMFGMTESLNLSVAAAISLYETTRRKRELLGQPGDLDNSYWKNYQAHYYMNSVSKRLVKALFKPIDIKREKHAK